ncbi:MAG TPA: 7TM diverse intracellular signaling domain-containing protein, partial [Leptospiraceae bacterium]|nr:7TM diverse intracellular signaling domain-containing protein [Leptospiraceae bacterium]
WSRLIAPEEFRLKDRPQPDSILQQMGPWKAIAPASGRATYRFHLRCEPMPHKLGLWFPHQFTASRVFANGKLIAETGIIGKTLGEDVIDRSDTLTSFDVSGPELELIFHISNQDSYRGGMRGSLVIGKPEVVSRYAQQRMLIEEIVLGIILGVAVYHLFFYFMHRTEYSFLFFSILCFFLAARMPFQGSKIYHILLGPISWESQLRFLAVITIGAPPIGAALLRGLFPDLVRLRSVFAYSAVAAISLLSQAGDLNVVSIATMLYAIVVYSFSGAHILFTTYRATRAGAAAIPMALGVGSLSMLGILAFVQNFRGRDGGYYALAAFLFFVIFQALALSRFFLGAVRARAEIAVSLQESRQALSQQRDDLQTSLHDSLGGALTDLQIHAEREMLSASGPSHDVLAGIYNRIVDAVKMFRSQLLFMEDLSMTANDLLPGVQMTLLRRYADASREIDFDFTDEAATCLSSQTEISFPLKRRLDLFFLIVELCTNDLKHGKGESLWRISTHEGKLCIVQKNGKRTPEEISAESPASATDRVHRLRGTIKALSGVDEYSIRIEIPLNG